MSVLFDIRGYYNLIMPILEPYIQKEYLALQINYCKKLLDALPDVYKTERVIRKVKRNVFILDSKLIFEDSKSGRMLENPCQQREQVLRELSRLEGLWNSAFKGPPPADIEPRKICRRLFRGADDSVIIDGKFFESLKNDADPKHRESKTFYYNGTYYRSAAEVDIARFYTENGIPFKYEPEIWLKDLKYPIYTDFVILIKELDLCKFHEHFGMRNAADYNRITASKYNNYSWAGLLPELDIFYTYDTDDVPFDLRTLSTKLNSAVYDSLFVPEISYFKN